ncbi:MAG: hypothetical protein EP305_07155 [Bacteroidetes bacterium]|jgi:hypothetical protein|nr:MAG: hypothetical protein EP305_07155 [Bacteroidota bacterium]
MRHVSLQSIENAIKKIDNLDDDGLERISETVALAQETLLGYAMSAAIEYNNPKLEGLLIYYFCLLNECFVQEGLRLRAVTEADIDEFEDPYFELLDTYFDTDNDDLLEEFCDQPNLTQFMAIEVSTEDDDGTSLDDETATQLFIVSLAIITLLGRAIIE